MPMAVGTAVTISSVATSIAAAASTMSSPPQNRPDLTATSRWTIDPNLRACVRIPTQGLDEEHR